MLIDLHIHSSFQKDSPLSPREIIARAKNTILDGLVFTDNGIYTDVADLKSYGEELGIVVLFGAEVHTDKGHMLVYLPDISLLGDIVRSSDEPVSVVELIKRVNGLGGAVVAAHPYKKDIDRPLGDGLFLVEGLTAIEVESGFTNSTANALAYEAASRLGIPMTGGSATKENLDNLGLYATLFAGRISNEKELVDKLKNARYYPVNIL